ncbi:MAG: Imm21 family immunity protein [Pseudomonadota bacterium]
MTDLYDWIETNGGPHLLVTEEALPEWRGIEGWTELSEDDPSDYARACRITDYMGLIPIGPHQALVFAGEVGGIAWLPTADGNGDFVQWLGVDDEADIAGALQDPIIEDLLSGQDAEHLTFTTSSSGVYRLIDAADRGDELLGQNAQIVIPPGAYDMRATYVDTETLILVVRRMTPRGAM